MCIFLLALMGMLLFYLSGEIESYYLVEKADGLSFQLAQGWDVLVTLWPALAFMFLAGVLTVALILKLTPTNKR